MHKSATKCNETIGKWCKNKHGASKIIDTFETYQSHIAKLSESVIKSEMCDSTKCEVESIHFESMRENEITRVVNDRICEDISTNVTMSTPSVVSCDMQVAFEEREPPILQPA
jgi:hypothetical protein